MDYPIPTDEPRVRQAGGTDADQTRADLENGRVAPLRGPSDTGASNAARRRPRPAWQLSPPWRKLLLTVHIIVSVGLLGADAAVLVLCIAGVRGALPSTVYPAAHLIAGTLLVSLASLALATGLAQGLLTPWGVVRYWWVAIKLMLNVAGLVLGLLVLVPTLGAADDAATAQIGVQLPLPERLGLVRDATAASIVLVVTVLLSVYKPFGRLCGRRSPAARRVSVRQTADIPYKWFSKRHPL